MGKGGTKGGFMKNGRIEDEGEQTEESFFFTRLVDGEATTKTRLEYWPID